MMDGQRKECTAADESSSENAEDSARGALRRAHAASDVSFRAALVALLPMLRAQARGLTGQRDAADDLVQETIALALRAATRPPEAALRPWTLVILRNAWRSEQRRRHRRAAGESAAAEAPMGPGAREPGSSGLAEALATLPPAQREALLLLTTQGIDGAEAARICGVPEGTLRARASRARKTLRRKLGMASPSRTG